MSLLCDVKKMQGGLFCVASVRLQLRFCAYRFEDSSLTSTANCYPVEKKYIVPVAIPAVTPAPFHPPLYRLIFPVPICMRGEDG